MVAGNVMIGSAAAPMWWTEDHMPAFLIDPRRIQDGRLEFSAEEAHHIRVRRLREGEVVDAIDGAGTAFRVRLLSLAADVAVCQIEETTPGALESRHELHLVAALIKGQRFDTVVEKATEVGVHTIQPMVTRRTVVKGAGKPERWQRIATAAAKQCGRSRIPDVAQVADLDQIAIQCAAEGMALLVADPTVPGSIEDVWEADKTGIALFVGPEGGFDADEIAFLKDQGARSFVWGERILRADTAAIVLSALVLDQARRHSVQSTIPQGVSE
mgnify:FL=1